MKALTGLRWFAAFHVILYHINLRSPLHVDKLLENFISAGAVGVTLFFVLSGFLLTVGYVNRTFTWVEFMQKRMARIAPVYWLSLVVATPFLWHYTLQDQGDTATVARAILSVVLSASFLQAWFEPTAYAWHPFAWSLSVEVFFYAAFPVLLPLLKQLPHKHLRAALLGTVLLSAIPALLYSGWPAAWHTAYSNPLVRLPEFVMGMLLGLVYLQAPQKTSFHGYVALSSVMAVLIYLGWRGPAHHFNLHLPVLLPLFGLMVYSLAKSNGSDGLTQFLNRPWNQVLGRWSYAFYLMQLVPLEYPLIFGWAQLQPEVNLLLVTGITLGLAGVTYHFVEAPGHKLLQQQVTA